VSVLPDLLVNLYQLKENEGDAKLNEKGIVIKRAFTSDRGRVADYVRGGFSAEWAYESEYAMNQNPISCFVAVKDKKIVGFACYDTSAKGFFGPMGVDESLRKNGIGGALLRRCLFAMREVGYAYAIIGWVGPIEFYRKEAGAVEIADSPPEKSVYKNMVTVD